MSYTIRSFLLSLTFLLFATITVYSTWFLWGGGGSWGARYTTTSCQLISLVAVPLMVKFNIKNIVLKALIPLSFLIQLSSVIFDFNLETSQGLGYFGFVIGQRFLNLVAVITGNFDNWGLRPTTIPTNEFNRFTTIAFFPWKNAPSILSPQLVIAVQIIWIILFLILIYAIFLLIKNVSTNQDQPQNGEMS